MTVNEFRVRPVTRYVLTHYTSGPDGSGVETVGEFQNVEQAERVGFNLCALLPGSTIRTIDGREPEWPTELLRRAISAQERLYVIVGRGFDPGTTAYYAYNEQEAEQRRIEAEAKHGQEFRVFSRLREGPSSSKGL